MFEVEDGVENQTEWEGRGVRVENKDKERMPRPVCTRGGQSL